MKSSNTGKASLLTLLILTLTCGLFVAIRTATAHCQVPCGIYDDQARINAMLEDAATITKAINKINELIESTSGEPQSVNQAVRWINTKEQHAANIITTVAEYFLTQKVKPVAPDAEGYDAYLNKLASHHAVMVAAMKTKQNSDPAIAKQLTDAINAFSHHYHNH